MTINSRGNSNVRKVGLKANWKSICLPRVHWIKADYTYVVDIKIGFIMCKVKEGLLSDMQYSYVMVRHQIIGIMREITFAYLDHSANALYLYFCYRVSQ